jgi:hypothetical protein
MKKNILLATMFAFAAAPAFASDTVPVDHLKNISQNGIALVSVLGAPDKVQAVTVKDDLIATTWTYTNKAKDAEGNTSDVHIILGNDGYAKAISFGGQTIGILINGQDEYAGSENVADVPA